MSGGDVGAGDILIEVTDAAARALPRDVLDSLKKAARLLEENANMNAGLTCGKVEVRDCVVFTECTDVQIG
jgi:hypothetical protein